MSRYPSRLLAVVAGALVLAFPKQSRADLGNPVTSEDIRNVCDKVVTCALSTPRDSVNFCNLLASEANDKSATWNEIAIPTRTELLGVLQTKCNKEAAQEKVDTDKELKKLKESLGKLAVPPGLTSTFGISQSALIWGATDFLLSRASLELKEWAVDRFVNKLCPDTQKANAKCEEANTTCEEANTAACKETNATYKRINAACEKAHTKCEEAKAECKKANAKYAKLGDDELFPNSCPLLKGFKFEGLLPGMVTYQAALRKDVAHLPVLIFKHVSNNETDARKKDMALAAMEATQALESELNGTAPILSLREIALGKHEVSLDCKAQPAATSVFMASALLASLPVKGGANPSIQIPAKKNEWVLALMALAVNAKDSESPIAAGWPSNCGTEKQKFEVEDLLRIVDKSGGAIQETIDASEELRKLTNGTAAGGDQSYRLALYARATASVFGVVNAVLEAVPEKIKIEPRDLKAFKGVENVARELGAANYGGAIIALTALAVDYATNANLPPDVLRVTTFAVDIAQAATPDAAAAAFERVAAPVGTYKRKRTANGVYAGVNAYFGLAGNYERAKGLSDSWEDAQWAFTAGAWAPFGGELGYGWNNVSLGLFVQAIDVGVLASWRFTNSDDSTLPRPEVGVAQVFSPGVYIVVGLPSAPVSFALGGSISPSLRSIGGTGGEEKRDAYRLGATIALDIPVFP